MTPKFIEVTQRVSGKPAGRVLVNPRRIDMFGPGDPKAPDSPAVLKFGRGEFLCVMETTAQVKTLLNT